MSVKFNKSFLKRVLSIPSVTYREERIRPLASTLAKRSQFLLVSRSGL